MLRGKITDKFNVYYVQSINNIVNSTKNILLKVQICRRRILMRIGVENEEAMEQFGSIEKENLEKLDVGHLKKKGTEERISS